MSSEPADATDAAPMIAEWPFPTAAALGSAVRAQGIEREIRARLPFPDRKRLSVEGGVVTLRIPAGQDERLGHAARIVSEVLAGAEALPVLPSEAEDILSISPRERQKWLKDGRLRSAGTRTVTMRGRSKSVTFHVFDPRHVEDVLDRDLPAIWREEDLEAAAERRRRAAAKAAATRSGKDAGAKPARGGRKARAKPQDAPLEGWDAFAASGLLR